MKLLYFVVWCFRKEKFAVILREKIMCANCHKCSSVTYPKSYDLKIPVKVCF